MSMTIDEYRIQIRFLDEKIEKTEDVSKKTELIDKNIQLNREYISLLRKPLAGRIVWCVILSILFFGMGLFIYLPSINVRKGRIRICEKRIAYLTQLKISIQED